VPDKDLAGIPRIERRPVHQVRVQSAKLALQIVRDELFVDPRLQVRHG
jgi:hypothetical protein